MPCISAAYAVMRCLSVCLSVRPSRSWIMSKRINVSSFFFSPSDSTTILADTANLAPRHTLRQCKPCTTSHCQTQQTSPHATLSGTANLAPRPTVRQSKPRPTPHFQAPQTLHHVSLADTANLAPRHTLRHRKPHTTSHCHVPKISPHAPLSDSANLVPRPTVRHKPRPVPHCQ